MINKLIGLLAFLVVIQCWSCGSDDDIIITEEDPVIIDSMMVAPFTINSAFHLSDVDLPSSNIERMLSHQNMIIILTNDDRFVRFNTTTSEVNLMASISSPVTDFYIDNDAVVCVSTSSKGIYGFDFMGNELFHLDTLNSCMPTNDVSTIVSNAAGELFFGCLSTSIIGEGEIAYQNGYGLWKMDRTGNNCMSWTPGETELSGNYIQDLAIGTDQTIWAAVSDNKPVYWAPGQATIDRLTEDGSWASFSWHGGTSSYTIITQLTAHNTGNVTFEATTDGRFSKHVGSILVEIKEEELKITDGSRLGLDLFQFLGVFSNGDQIFHGSYVIPTEESYVTESFLILQKENELVDYSSYLTESYFKGLTITADDRIWLANNEGIHLLTFD